MCPTNKKCGIFLYPHFCEDNTFKFLHLCSKFLPPKHLKFLHLYLEILHIYHYNTLILLTISFKASIKNKILKNKI